MFSSYKSPNVKNGKILYAVQATGNGHISRAMELLPYLQQYGHVDVFLSGSNSNLPAQLPVKYQSKGLSLFYGNSGGLNYWKMWKELNLKRVYNEAKQLPIEDYEWVINDFESITSLACKLKNKASVHFGHQASFLSSATPRPNKKDAMGELILKHYATATAALGLHFQSYDSFICQPIIKSELLQATPSNLEHVTVYLSHYSDEVLQAALATLPAIKFHVFSKKVKQVTQQGNIIWMPISKDGFNNSMLTCDGLITGAGFETPAEALYLGKKLMCLPIKGQYEQMCNAAALQQMGVTVVPTIQNNFANMVQSWISEPAPEKLILQQSTFGIVQKMMDIARNQQQPSQQLSEQETINQWLNYHHL